MRAPGIPNKATADIRAIAQGMLRDEEYVNNLVLRLRSGVAPHIETLLWHYAYGRPPSRLELSGPQGKPMEVHFYIPNNKRTDQFKCRGDEHGAAVSTNGNGEYRLSDPAEAHDAEAADEPAQTGADADEEHLNGAG